MELFVSYLTCMYISLLATSDVVETTNVETETETETETR